MKSVASSKSIPIVLGASVCGLAGYLLYLLFKNDEDLKGSQSRVSNYKIVEVRIPKDIVRVLIGRNGKTIKSIQNDSHTKINFKEIEEKDGCVCVIKGTTEACIFAGNLIRTFIENQSILQSEDFWVPKASVGAIIGRGGEQIHQIMNITGTTINIDRNRNEQTQRVTIKGTTEQINSAKSCIEEIVRECENNLSNMKNTLSKREPRLPGKLESPKSQTESSHTEHLVSPVQVNSQFEVYVSAMVDPSHFWLQLVGSKATELDKLVAEMTEYYGNQNNRDFHLLQNVDVGDLVAAVFPYDKKWYRAEVLTTISDNPDQRYVELYYVDYGDTDVLPINEVFELRTDFLRLYFQAIECFLARVEPSSKKWSPEAVDKFEEWTRVAQWKKLSARINGYNARGKTRAKREGSPVPGVDLFDVRNQQDIDIAQELVKYGYAVFKKDSDLKSVSSRGTSISNTSVDSIS